MNKNIMKSNQFKFSMLLHMVLFSIIFCSCSDMEKDYVSQLVTYPELKVSGFSPKTGKPTSMITIQGSNFGDASQAAEITFNGIAIAKTEIISYADTEIVFRVPANASSGDITLKVWGKSAQLGRFEVLPGGTITGVSALPAFEGDVLTIQGTGFLTDLSLIRVKFGTLTAEVVSASSTQIKVKVPVNVINDTDITVEFLPNDQTLVSPVKFALGGEVKFDLFKFNYLAASNRFNGGADSTTYGVYTAQTSLAGNLAYVVFPFVAPADGKYIPYCKSAYGGSDQAFLNVDFGTDLAALAAKDYLSANSVQIPKTGWGWSNTAEINEYSFPQITCVKGQTYYIKVTWYTNPLNKNNTTLRGVRLVLVK